VVLLLGINSLSLLLSDSKEEIEELYSQDSLIKTSGTTTNFTEKELYAIIIGIENYTGIGFDLDYCKDDALDMVSFLTVSCNVPNENIILLVDRNATVSSIDSAFTQINTTIKPEDELLVYFSGHGDDGYFQTYYGVPANSSAYYNYTHLDNILDGINCSKKYILIDACYSGSVIPICSDLNRAIMTACAISELCYEDSVLQNGIFTYYFINAFNNSLDINSDDVISFEEMYNTYIYGNARNYAKQRYGQYQTSQLYDGVTGETVVYPSIGAVSYEISNIDNLQYDFFIFGTGLIYNISLIVYVNNTEIFFNLTSSNSTHTAFGSYSGVIKLNSTENPENCTISVFVEGFINKTIIHDYIFVDSVPIDPPEDLFVHNYFLTVLLIVVVFITVYIIKSRKIVEE